MKTGKWLFLALALLAGSFSAVSPVRAADEPEVVDLDSFTEPFEIRYGTLQIQPIAGWFTYNVTEGRTMKAYLPEEARLRARFTAVAVPDGVDTWEFLDENGWIAKADELKECVVALEPGEGGWGDAAAESEYVAAAMGALSGKNHNDITVWQTHGTYAVAGYGKGCALLENYVLENPMNVYAQVYIGGEGAGEAAYQTAEEAVYKEINKITPEQFEEGMASMGLTVDDACRKSDFPTPTWFVGYAEDDPAIAFWKKAVDAVEEPAEDGVFYQSIDSDAFQTLYANKNIKSWNPDTAYGLSQVKITDDTDVTAEDIFAFTGAYTNYTALWAYSNNLAPHMNYSAVVTASVDSAKTGVKSTYEYTNLAGEAAVAELYAMEETRVQYDRSSVGATLYAGSIATKDYDENGTMDPREILIYVPDTVSNYGEDGCPMVYVSPGASQTAETFLDVSGWVPVANDAGCVLVFINQQYNTPASVKFQAADDKYLLQEDHESVDFARGVMAYMKEGFTGANIDFTRVYASGHSAGSNSTEQLGLVSEGDWIAAIGSTSLFSMVEFEDGVMPTYLMVGQTDLDDGRLDLTIDPYVTTPHTEGAHTLFDWLNKLLKKNGINKTIAPDDKEAFLASCDQIDGGRYTTYSWANDQGIILAKFGRTMLRQHNSFPEEARLAWNYMEQFRLVDNGDGTQTRFYSPSAFVEEDAVAIEEP